jgi:putative methanogenesis marker protein 6
MKDYVPLAKGTVTKYIFVESIELTPSDLAIRAYEVSGGAMIKETCFGLQVTGPAKDVDDIVERLRALDPDHIFVKDRGFPPGDSRRCRANLGGARPGFHGHEFEISLLRHISAGLSRIREGGEPGATVSIEPEEEKHLDVYHLKKIIESMET